MPAAPGVNQERRTIRLRVALIVLGAVLLVATLAVSNSALERSLRGDATGALSWGPSLFRGLIAFHALLLLLLGIRGLRRAEDNGAVPAYREPHQTRRFPWVIIATLSLVALVLRLWKLESDLWIDEILTLVDFVRPPLGEIVTSFASQNQHMLYSMLAHVSIDVFGESAWALRLPSVVFGVGSLWALFLLGRRVVGTREALLACALMTVSYHHLWFSQNARGYMGLLFFSTLSTWFWLEALARAGRWWVYYALSITLGMWTHLTMAFVVTAHLLVYLTLFVFTRWDGGLVRARVSNASTRWHAVLAWLLSVTSTLQLYALAFPQFLREAFGEVSLESEWTNPLWVLSESLRSLQVGFSGIAVVLAGMMLVGSGWWSILRRDFAAAASMTAPAIICGVSMLALGHNMWPRFFFFSMGFALLIVVRGAMVIPQAVLSRVGVAPPWQGLAGAGLATLMIAASASSLPRYYTVPKQDFTGARDFVEENLEADAAVVAVGLAGMAYGRYYAPDWLVPQNRLELDEIRRTHPSLWLVYTLPIQLRAFHPETWDVIDADFEVVRFFPGSLGDGEVFVCRERPGKE